MEISPFVLAVVQLADCEDPRCWLCGKCLEAVRVALQSAGAPLPAASAWPRGGRAAANRAAFEGDKPRG